MAPRGLTAREVDVLRLLARGLTNKKIAEQLVIARKTADHHVEHIYSKIGVPTARGPASSPCRTASWMTPRSWGEHPMR